MSFITNLTLRTVTKDTVTCHNIDCGLEILLTKITREVESPTSRRSGVRTPGHGRP